MKEDYETQLKMAESERTQSLLYVKRIHERELQEVDREHKKVSRSLVSLSLV